MLLQAYFDESGKLSDKSCQHVVFGGIAGRMDEISVFSRRWQSILGSDIDHIHMKDAMHFNGAFRGWKEKASQRDEILIECAKVAHRSSALQVVSELDSPVFRRLDTALRKRLKDPVYSGFEGCVRVLAGRFRQHNFSLYYDESHDYAEECLKLYRKLKNLHVNFAARLTAITFADDSKVAGLQAADMIAYSAFVGKRDGERAPRVIREINAIFRQQVEGAGDLVYTNGDTLGDGILES